MPSAGPDEVRVTWIGHSSFLLQIGGRNLLTDPVWSRRASPISWLGPSRMTEPGVKFEQLPPIHGVLISHDHYDHLDAPTVRRIARAQPHAQWIAPLGHTGLLRSMGVQSITELDWWQDSAAIGVQVTATPVQHWTRRVGSAPGARLWCSYAISAPTHRIYFGGDSGYCPAFAEIGKWFESFDVAILPIGAYEPRWFMKHAHMNPEEAVRAFRELNARHFVSMHWGSFRLTDEDPLEPPVRTREAWQAQQLPESDLHILAVGETLRV